MGWDMESNYGDAASSASYVVRAGAVPKGRDAGKGVRQSPDIIISDDVGYPVGRNVTGGLCFVFCIRGLRRESRDDDLAATE